MARARSEFDVAAGSRNATFNGAADTVLQTGTTAGTLRLEAVTETGITSETFRLERGIVVVDNATARRDGSNLEIEINGYDNTREVGSLNLDSLTGRGMRLAASSPRRRRICFVPISRKATWAGCSDCGRCFQ